MKKVTKLLLFFILIALVGCGEKPKETTIIETEETRENLNEEKNTEKVSYPVVVEGANGE